ncbi:MAG: UDP-3-O-(3-hydroxymyristoyl)glucosamine N-acyltransferase [Bacteroidetes bacterium]|nr:UDP-3-O-(3-hydroxymyristoyl)glucosamine N-acyltransferase [Bacteroidota bacterium]HET6245773.1 UDP-3-O-(3-hydroxymyristoyl)glucosamine N-acyltransferase [Bacteroidia bacterium]
MEFTASQVAEILNGSIEGNAEIKVSKLSKIEEGETGSITFLANPQYTQYIYNTQASVVIVNRNFVPASPIKETCTLIRVDDPYKAFSKLLGAYSQLKRNKKGIEAGSYIAASALIGKDVYVGATAYIGENAIIGDNVKIYPQVYVGDNVIIKAGTTLFPGVKIYSDCHIGSECEIHSGVIIGADGFGFTPNAENNYEKVPQIGNVIIEDHVEIGANTCIDRATLGSTIIRKGVKLDNLIQIAHNVEIGENTVIAAQAGIAGSVKIGKNCMLGGQTGYKGHITLSDNVKVGAQAGVGVDLKEGEIVMGSPSFPIGDFRRSHVLFRTLPKLNDKIKNLTQEIEALKKELHNKI